MVLEVTATDQNGKVLFNEKRNYFEIGLDLDGDMRYGAWQIKELMDLSLQPKEVQREWFLLHFEPTTTEATIEVTLTYCLSGKKCDVIERVEETLSFYVD